MIKPSERLKSVQTRILKACIAADRQPGSVSLLAVSKRQPGEAIISLNSMGLVSFGENLLQEARQKQLELVNLQLQWHFIGHIQSNKTREIAEHFQWVQSVDREKILKRLSAQRPDSLDPLNICLQVNIDREPQKGGASPEDILQLAEVAQGLGNICLRGLMAIPRHTTVVAEQRLSFGKVRALFEQLQRVGHDVDTLSMGMSADLEAAISEGSTMVRIGTDLFGTRES